MNKHASEGCCKLILGNKSDAPGRAVTTEEARETAEGMGIAFLETSAKTGTFVDTAFLMMAHEIKNKMMNTAPKSGDGVDVSSSKKGGCC